MSMPSLLSAHGALADPVRLRPGAPLRGRGRHASTGDRSRLGFPLRCRQGSDAIGQLPLAEVVEAARKAAGAEIVRTLRQGQPITKEFRVGRLNLVLDAEGRITSANCG